MYAIVEIGGEQCKVTASAKVRVPKLVHEAGKKIEFDRVLLVVDGGNASIGRPVVENAVVKATVLIHDKDKKVMVFKKKRRKDYKVKKGHRQQFTELHIDSIVVGGKVMKQTGAKIAPGAKKAPAAKKAKPAAAKATTAQKKPAAAKSTAKPAAKKEPVKAPAAKSPASKAKPDTSKQ